MEFKLLKIRSAIEKALDKVDGVRRIGGSFGVKDKAGRPMADVIFYYCGIRFRVNVSISYVPSNSTVAHLTDDHDN